MTTETGTMPQESVQQKVEAASAVDTNANPGSRVLHVGRVGWYYTQILDSDKTTPLYTISNRYGNAEPGPRMTISNAGTNSVVGTVTIHPLSKNMDLVVHEKPICLEASSALTTGRVFTSQAAAGRKFKWAFDNAIGRGMACTDDRDKVVAKFDGSSSLTSGENYFTVEPGFEGELLEEILISGLAMMERRAQRNRHGFGGTVVSGIRVAGHPFKGSSHE